MRIAGVRRVCGQLVERDAVAGPGEVRTFGGGRLGASGLLGSGQRGGARGDEGVRPRVRRVLGTVRPIRHGPIVSAGPFAPAAVQAPGADGYAGANT